MIHLYYGYGKGKTTAAMGLAIRMAGRGKDVVIVQFLKSSDSGERAVLAHVPGVHLLPAPERLPFSFALTQEEREQETLRYARLLEECLQLARDPNCGLVVLDEVCDAVDAGLVPMDALLKALENIPAEVVLTGHAPVPEFHACAHYITCFQKERHPYDSGTAARRGVEF